MDIKQLFENSPGFGDVCYEKFGRYPSIQTLERKDVRPGNVKKLPVDSGVNPITHDFRVNYTEWRKHMIAINKKFETLLPIDGIQFLMSTTCHNVKNGIIFCMLLIVKEISLFCNVEDLRMNVKLIIERDVN
jgi:hypothetical protein